jgi:hypothetical protein
VLLTAGDGAIEDCGDGGPRALLSVAESEELTVVFGSPAFGCYTCLVGAGHGLEELN